MIKKIDLQRRKSFGTLDWLEQNGEPSGAELIESKINELCDAVNSIVSVQEKLIDSRFVVETKNTPQPIKLYVCPDGSVYDNEDVAKSHTAIIFNPSPAGATTTDRVYLEQELERTREALKIAVDALKEIKDGKIPVSLGICMDINDALEQIKALEQKE